jgi:protein disulfide-isomerase
MAKQYDIEGFPTVLILNAQGKLVEKTGYRAGGAVSYVAYLSGVLDNDRKKGAAPAAK